MATWDQLLLVIRTPQTNPVTVFGFLFKNIPILDLSMESLVAPFAPLTQKNPERVFLKLRVKGRKEVATEEWHLLEATL